MKYHCRICNKEIGYNSANYSSSLCKSCIRKGMRFTKEHKENISKSRKGQKLTNQTKEKMSKVRKGQISKKVLSRKFYKNYKEYNRNYKNIIVNKLINRVRVRTLRALNGIYKVKPTIKLLGCSVQELKQHLQKQFTKGMTWDNYGIFGWHIDHIRPCYSFDLSKKLEQLECFNYKNLQPLWAKDNLSKGKKEKNHE